MTLIAGVVGTEAHDAAELLDAMERRVMGIGRPVRRACGQGFGLLSTGQSGAPGAAAECDLATTRDGQRVVAFDGRVDNRDDLTADLGLPPDARRTDDALVLEAYVRWGAACSERIYGDFALAIWDGDLRRLFCARDVVGVRPFFYHFDGRHFLFSSQVGPLLAWPNLPSAIDEEYFADYLVHGSGNNLLTPFRSIRKLPPGHFALVEADRLSVERYWNGPPKLLRYSRDEEYTEHFLELFQRAVARRLGSDGPVFCDLSGGLDSPSIVCVAHRHLKRHGGPKLNGITVIFDQARQSDEREWARLVATELGLAHHEVVADRHHPFKDVADGARYWDEPHAQLCSFALHRAYVELIRNDCGSRVLLGGMGAEEVLTTDAPEPLHLADLLRERRWGDLGRQLRIWQEALDVPMHRLFIHNGIKPLLRPQRNYYLARSNRTVPAWADRRFSRRWDLARRLNTPWMERRYGRASRQWQWERLHRITPNLPMGYLGKHIEMRYPFLDRSLVEFGLAVPWERKVHPYARKPILRRAMRGILPEPLRMRAAKIGADQAVYLAIAREWEQLEPLVRESRLADLGMVDGAELRNALQLARHGHSSQLAVLFWTLAAEVWVREWLAP